MTATLIVDSNGRLVPALSTTTPGVYLRRSRSDRPCAHPTPDDGACERCPARRWVWTIALACGHCLGGGLTDALNSKQDAHAVATSLAAWPVDWTASVGELAAMAASPLGRDHMQHWIRAIADGDEPHHRHCSSCPPLPQVRGFGYWTRLRGRA